MRRPSPNEVLLASLIADTVQSAVSRGSVIMARHEAHRISDQTGISHAMVARALVTAAIKAHANVEIPKLDEADPYTALIEGKARLRVAWRNPKKPN